MPRKHGTNNRIAGSRKERRIIKGRYVALVEVDYCTPKTENTRSIEDMRSDLANGVVAKELRHELEEIFKTEDPGYTMVNVTQQYVDVFECPEERKKE